MDSFPRGGARLAIRTRSATTSATTHHHSVARGCPMRDGLTTATGHATARESNISSTPVEYTLHHHAEPGIIVYPSRNRDGTAR